MSLTRKFLKALGLEEDKIEQIIGEHTEVTDALKTQLKEAQDSAGTLAEITKERDKLQAKVTEIEAKAPDAAKVQAEFDAYKAQVDGEKTTAKKQTLFQEALKAAGVARESAQKALLKVVDLSASKLDKDGKLDGAESLIATLKTEYADFFTTTENGGVPSTNPPAGGLGGMTKEAFKKLPLIQQMNYLNAHPDEAKALI